jgi:(p)ppGpp synthase/HD superfamily hydrolase
MILTDRFPDALTFAERPHRTQTRKGNNVRYISHLMAVCGTVLEWGGDGDTAIAALLHAAVEDQGGAETLCAIEARFGARVAKIVAACSDSFSPNLAEKKAWEVRKRACIAKLATAESDIALVTAADKLHNIAAIIPDVQREGPTTRNTRLGDRARH